MPASLHAATAEPDLKNSFTPPGVVEKRPGFLRRRSWPRAKNPSSRAIRQIFQGSGAGLHLDAAMLSSCLELHRRAGGAPVAAVDDGVFDAPGLAGWEVNCCSLLYPGGRCCPGSRPSLRNNGTIARTMAPGPLCLAPNIWRPLFGRAWRLIVASSARRRYDSATACPDSTETRYDIPLVSVFCLAPPLTRFPLSCNDLPSRARLGSLGRRHWPPRRER